METLNTLQGLRLAALRAKGYTAEQIAALSEALYGILDDVNTSLEALEAHAASAHAPASAEENVIVSIKRNGVAVAPVDKIVNLLVPTKTSELTNDAGFATDSAVEAAVKGAGHLKAEVVETLPTASAADADTIYFVRKNNGGTGTQYRQYRFINGTAEIIGQTDVDLSAYAQKTEVAKATDALIRSIISTEQSTDEKYLGTGNLALFWSLIKPMLGGTDVAELNARVELLELVVLNKEIEGNPYIVTFGDLSGLSVTGIWDQSEQRIVF